MYVHLTLLGNVGRDPELRYTPTGMAVCNFSLATNRKWTDRDSGEKKEETTWWKVAVWGNQAETVNQYVEKGMTVLVDASRISSQGYVSDQDGTVRSSLEVTANFVRFVGKGGKEETLHGGPDEHDDNYGYTNEGRGGKGGKSKGKPASDVDDIPF